MGTLCPVCKIELNEIEVDINLPAHKCSNCHGQWINSTEYLAWRSASPTSSLDEIDFDVLFDLPYPIIESNQALICPEDGRFLRRYKIWPNNPFHLDRCSSCHGIWFDGNEWQALHDQKLHSHINLFFTNAWEEKLRSKEMEKRLQQMYVDLFGTVDYKKIREIREWLSTNPNGNRLFAYLIDKEPYKA